MLLSTLDGTIVATALPSITADIGGVSGITWVVTAYLLAQIATMPLYGKLGDVYGRKWVFLVAISVFTVGSMLCGISQSLEQLVGGPRAAGPRRRWPRVRWRWRSSVTSSRRDSSVAGSGTRARSSRSAASPGRSPAGCSSTT